MQEGLYSLSGGQLQMYQRYDLFVTPKSPLFANCVSVTTYFTSNCKSLHILDTKFVQDNFLNIVHLKTAVKHKQKIIGCISIVSAPTHVF